MKTWQRVPLAAGVLLGWSLDAAAQTPAESAAPLTGQATLPHDLSAWGMFMGADPIVKAILMGLALASVVTWTVAFAKLLEMAAASRGARRARATLLAAKTIGEAFDRLASSRGVVRLLAAAARDEMGRSGPDMPVEGIKERTAMRLQRIEAAENRRLLRGTGILATIGATAPFVGLLGTVWGIMNSFIGISKAHTTNLAVVAPGIAEALLATAIGLAAAIPAVIVYNVLSRVLSGYRGVIGDASAEILRTVSRDLDRAAQTRGPHGAAVMPHTLAAE